jgi:hypothetical protein
MVRWSESAILQWVQNRINHAFDSYNVLTRIVEFLQSNPDEGVSAEDIAVKFDVNRKDLHAMLVVAINQELLICSRNGTGEYVYYLPSHSTTGTPTNSAAGTKKTRSTETAGSL